MSSSAHQLKKRCEGRPFGACLSIKQVVHPPVTTANITMSTPTQSYTRSDLVLVTSANCHVGQHVVDQLLSLPNGPRVRGTVRSNATAKQIIRFYTKKGSVKDRLDVFVVPDTIKPGAFDEAVKGMVKTTSRNTLPHSSYVP
jgi:hypothetical protein